MQLGPLSQIPLQCMVSPSLPGKHGVADSIPTSSGLPTLQFRSSKPLWRRGPSDFQRLPEASQVALEYPAFRRAAGPLGGGTSIGTQVT